MKVALVSGFLNEHLLPLCEELNKKSDFYFIATQKLSHEEQYKEQLNRDYVVQYYDIAERQSAISAVLESDVVIFGGSSSELLKMRKQTGKLSFIYTERFFKKGSWRRFIPKTAKILKTQFIDRNDNLYVLCSGSFVANDLKLIGFDIDKCFKFGYFPLADTLPFEKLIEKKQNTIPKLLFVGRLIKLKRTMDVLKCCKRLSENNIPFELDIVGDGPERKKLESFVVKNNLNNVHFQGSNTKKEVLRFMQQSNLCFVASTRLEGWAAVINESLSQACPVIASKTCGATAYLIKDGFNGYSYKTANINDLYFKTLEFIDNKNKTALYKNAFETVMNEWNAKNATDRFLKISECLLCGKTTDLYENGPLSKCI